MKIKITNIPDISKNLDQAKADLGNRVIENISPLLDEYYVSKKHQLTEMKHSLKAVRKDVIEKKNLLENLIKTLEKKKKIKLLLERISRLVTAGLGYDSSFRNETIVLLKVLDNLPEQKLDFHLKDVQATISKRFK